MNGFPTAPIKHLATIVGRIGWHGLSTNDYNTVGEYLVTGTEFAGGAIAWQYCHRVSTEIWKRDPRIQLSEGDVLVTKDGTIGKVALVDRLPGPATLNSGVFRISLYPDLVEPKFAFWVLSSRLFSDFIDLISSGSTIGHLYQADFVDFEFPLPPLPAQRAIADFLDAETADLDSILEKTKRLIRLVEVRYEAIVERHIRGLIEHHGAVPLKRATRDVEVGIVITPSAWYADEGVLAIRGLNVEPGRIVLDDVVHISEEGHRLHRKSILHADDIVCVRTGQAGAAAVVPFELDGCNCIDLVIVRPLPTVNSKFLEFVLNSDWTQKHIVQFSVGTIQSHFNVGAMREVQIPLPPSDEQMDCVEVLSLAASAKTLLMDRLSIQVDLLSERRQALITAAVTGQIPIPGAA